MVLPGVREEEYFVERVKELIEDRGRETDVKVLEAVLEFVKVQLSALLGVMDPVQC